MFCPHALAVALLLTLLPVDALAATVVLGEQTPTTMQLDASTTTMPIDTVCTVDFRMSSSQTLGAVQFDTDYAATGDGSFEGLGPAVLCTGLVTGALHSFNDIEAGLRLRTSILKLNGFTGPVNLSTCSFVPVDTLPAVTDFVITVVDAATPESDPVVPLPTVEVSAVSCSSASTSSTTTTSTTTTSTTSTTLPVCGDGDLQALEECDDGLANSDVTPDACRTDCTSARCGDSVTDTSEECDQGPANSDVTPDACRTDCSLANCGDTFIDTGEQCDDGASNSNANLGVCRRDCSLPYVCGDANGSGAVSASDSQWILMFAVGGIDRCELGSCDTTGDGRVTASDAQRALFEAVALPVELRCTLPVRFGILDAMLLGSLSFEVQYGATGSSFLGSGTTVACVGLLPETTLTFENDAEGDTLRVTASSLAGIGGPVDVAECQFRERAELPEPEAFTPQVTSATGIDGSPVGPPSIGLRF